MSIRRLWVLVRHLPEEAALWRVVSQKPDNVISVSDFAKHYRQMKGGK